MASLKGILILIFIIIGFVTSGQSLSPTDASKNSKLLSSDTNGSKPYALIAGGSKGIGYAIAEAFAKRGYNLVLIARHRDSLMGAKEKLESAYGISVEIL